MPTDNASPVKRSRLVRGMTLRELADTCADAGVRVDVATLSKIERGVHTPRPRLRATLASILELDIDQFSKGAA